MPLTRITVTVPASLVRSADRAARRENRSRSWIVAEALRRYADGAAPAAAAPFAAAADDARTQHLRAEQQLSPAARLDRAEELGTLAREQQRRGPREQVIAFDNYDDFYQWKAARLIGA